MPVITAGLITSSLAYSAQLFLAFGLLIALAIGIALGGRFVGMARGFFGGRGRRR